MNVLIFFNQLLCRIESELSDKQIKLERLKSTKSQFKVYLNKTLPMIENLSHYLDKVGGINQTEDSWLHLC